MNKSRESELVEIPYSPDKRFILMTDGADHCFVKNKAYDVDIFPRGDIVKDWQAAFERLISVILFHDRRADNTTMMYAHIQKY
jgi:hypothetical protein